MTEPSVKTDCPYKTAPKLGSAGDHGGAVLAQVLWPPACDAGVLHLKGVLQGSVAMVLFGGGGTLRQPGGEKGWGNLRSKEPRARREGGPRTTR